MTLTQGCTVSPDGVNTTTTATTIQPSLATADPQAETELSQSPFPPVSASPTNRTDLPPSIQGSMGRLENPEVGYSLLYPGDWQLRGQVMATEFANGAQCESVEVVDFQPPPEAGPGAFVLHSFVQVCAKPLTDSSTLDDFMRRTYGDALAGLFQMMELDGVRAYRATNEDLDVTIFLQTNDYRVQIVSSVEADPDQRSERISQVQTILDSLSLVRK